MDRSFLSLKMALIVSSTFSAGLEGAFDDVP